MSRDWFRVRGWVYRPVGWTGFVLVILAVIFCVQVFVAVDRRSHSASDTFRGISPFVVPCLMLLNGVASRTSGGAPAGPGRGSAGG